MQSLYFIAILPPLSLSVEIDKIRKQCAFEYKVFSALKPPVHITLIPPFNLVQKLESQLISTLEQCRNFQPFEQKLQDYDGFPPNVIFIKALKNQGITTLYKILKAEVKIYLKKIPSSISPHITIAYRDVEPATYKGIMETYGKRHFRATFEVTKFALLKHNGKKWNLFKEFESKPQEKQYKMDL